MRTVTVLLRFNSSLPETVLNSPALYALQIASEIHPVADATLVPDMQARDQILAVPNNFCHCGQQLRGDEEYDAGLCSACLDDDKASHDGK